MDLYRVLGLTHTADAAAIRAAYRRLAKQCHPDVSTQPDAHERFIAITEAYEVLSDPTARLHYDRTRLSPSPRTASPRTEARYARDTRARQQAGRAKAEHYGRMRYEEFDTYAFDTVAGYVAPKMLGCLGIGIVGFALVIAFVFAHERLGLPRGVAVLSMLLLLPACVYASMRFDEWHNARQRQRKQQERS